MHHTHHKLSQLTGAMAIFIAMALSWLSALAEPPRALPAVEAPARADSLTASLVTCYPGPEIYELCGHAAIRVRGEGIDSVWNYGMFDFREPNFVYRFVKGETDYMVGGYPFEWFLPEYERRGSKVVEQDLNLTAEEADRLLALLRRAALPENRRYRYNYVKNNCATRIYEIVDSAAGARVIYPDSVAYGSFRNEMRAYHRGYPWYQFGIDLALGSGIDYPVTAREEMFVPVEMMRNAAGARMADGRLLVKSTRVLNEGAPDATLGATPWYAGPLFWSWVVFALAIVVALIDVRRSRATRWVYSLWFLMLGLAGTLLAFLVFISSHEATSPNTLIIWLNPLQLLFSVCVWWRVTRPAATAMAYYNIVATVCMLVVWPFQHQSANPAFFPLMGATLVLASAYAIIAHKDSYNNNGPMPSRRRNSGRKSAAGRASNPTKRKRTATAK